MKEPFVCDECGCEGVRAAGKGWCESCEKEYREGVEDVLRWQLDKAAYGDDEAMRMEMDREYRRA